MTTLLVDIGNTALKWAVLDERGSGGMAAALAVRVQLHRDDAAWSDRLARAWDAVPAGVHALGCTVAGPALRDAVETIAARRGIRVQWLTAAARHTAGFVLENGYRVPTQLGTDRWHGMLGACARRPRQSFVLVAAGTATTADCVQFQEADGVACFLGGCIAPGEQMMLEALARRTAGLPLAQGTAVDFPDNTDDAIATGVLAAQVGAARHMAQRLARRLGRVPAVLVSGGDAERVVAGLAEAGIEAVIEHNLVLAGLALRADER